jgi:hypothetical protein
MMPELLLTAILIGSMGAAIMLAAVLCDIRGPKKRGTGAGTGTEWPKAA